MTRAALWAIWTLTILLIGWILIDMYQESNACQKRGGVLVTRATLNPIQYWVCVEPRNTEAP